MPEKMTQADHLWFNVDTPTNLMVITGILEFDKPLNYDRLLDTIRYRLLKFDRFRKRVVTPLGGMGISRWEIDPHFDLRYHVQRVALPAPGDKAALEAFVSDLSIMPLDTAKPLWQIHLIEKCEGDKSVLFVRVHHCMGDGIAFVRLLLSLTDQTPDAPWPAGTGRKPSPTPAENDLPPSRGFRERIGSALTRGRKAGSMVKSTLAQIQQNPQVLREKMKFAADFAFDFSSVLGKLTLSPADPKTSFKGELGVRKKMVWSDPLPLEDVKTIGKAVNATVNDVLIAAVTGALRHYLRLRNDQVNSLDLRVAVPVNIRQPGTELELGNKFSLVFIMLPVHVEDPVLRIREVKRRMDSLKTAPDVPMGFVGLSLIGMMPGFISKVFAHFLANKSTAVMSNVPGPQIPLYFAGGEIKTIMFWVPRSADVSLGISVISYDQRVTMGIAVDQKLVADPEIILDGFRKEFCDLLDLVQNGRLEPEPLVLFDRYLENQRDIWSSAEEAFRIFPTQDPIRCQALTKSGRPCKNLAKTGFHYCSVHHLLEGRQSPSPRFQGGGSL